MYSWGDDTSTWKNPGAYDYGSARRGYLDDLAAKASLKGPRVYSAGSAPDSKLVGTKDKRIHSDSENPLVVAVDVTGSMASWPAEIFDRLPLLYQTLSKYKEDLEVSFVAIGDANSDRFPLQVNDFGKGPDLDDHLKAIFPEGGGGGQTMETYELFAYYMLNNSDTPNATSPFMIIFGDEGFYDKVNPGQIRHYIGQDVQGPVDSMGVWKALQQKYNIFMLHKPYHSSGLDKEIVDQWGRALGPQKVIPLYDSERAVDVAMGIIAKHWGQFGDFDGNLKARQDDSDRKSVYASLRYVNPALPPGGKSILVDHTGGDKSTKLIGS